MNIKFYLLSIIIACITLAVNAQIQIGPTLLGDTTFANYGASVSINTDGSVFAIGCPQSDAIGNGYVEVYNVNGSDFEKIGDSINGINGIDPERFGASVSLNGSGDLLAIGAPRAGRNGRFSGAVRIFENQSAIWTQKGSEIVGGTTATAGTSVAINGAGTSVLLGAPGWQQGSGMTFLYENTGTPDTWSQVTAQFLGTRDANIGRYLSLSKNGEVFIVGDVRNDSVKVFYDNGGWQQRGSTLADTTSGISFGLSVSINEDGTIIAIGAPTHSGNASESGMVRTYHWSNETSSWQQMGADILGLHEGERIGKKVYLSDDGTTLAVAGFGTNLEGIVRIYKYENDAWSQFGIDIAGDNNNDSFGTALAISGDGNFMIAASTVHNSSTGAVKYYDISRSADTTETNLFDELEAYFTFDDEDVIDSISKQAYTSTYTALVSDGVINGSHEFQQTDFVRLFNFQPSSFTINLWFRTNNANVDQRIFHKGYVGGSIGLNFCYSLVYGSAGLLRFNMGNPLTGTNNPEIFDTNYVSPLDWHMITCSFESSTNTMALYVDGLLKDSLSTINSYPQISTPLELSRYPSNSNQQAINGNIDEMALWNRALHVNEVDHLYELQHTNITSFKPKFENNALRMYPNPFNSTLKVYTEKDEIVRVTIYNMLGEAILKKEMSAQQTINTRELKKGTYLVEIKGRSGSSREQFIKF